MDIFFCDVCCARVTGNHLSRGHGVRNADVIICGSCLEKGHGAELLVEANVAEAAVGAAPRLAGAAALDEPRDRASTMKNLEPIEGAPDNNDEILDLHDESALESEEGDFEQTLLANEEAAQDEVADVEETAEPELVADVEDVVSDQLEVVDLDNVNLDNPEDNNNEEDDSAVDELEAAAAVVDVESDDQKPISAEDAVDDLDDSGSYPVQESNRLDDADESQHTDSYSADELAAIKRLAEKEKTKADSGIVAAPSGKSSGRRKSSTSSRRSTAQSGRSASSRKSARKPSSKSSRKTSTRSKAKKEPMPLPLMISFITIPLLIVIFIIIASTTGGDSGRKEQKYELNVTGLNAKVDHVYRDAQKAYQKEELNDLYAAQKKIREAMQMKNEVVERLEKAGYTDGQMDKSLRKFRKLMQLERAVRDKIEEVKSRQGL